MNMSGIWFDSYSWMYLLETVCFSAFSPKHGNTMEITGARSCPGPWQSFLLALPVLTWFYAVQYTMDFNLNIPLHVDLILWIFYMNEGLFFSCFYGC
jgi:hypothetical protein